MEIYVPQSFKELHEGRVCLKKGQHAVVVKTCAYTCEMRSNGESDNGLLIDAVIICGDTEKKISSQPTKIPARIFLGAGEDGFDALCQMIEADVDYQHDAHLDLVDLLSGKGFRCYFWHKIGTNAHLLFLERWREIEKYAAS